MFIHSNAIPLRLAGLALIAGGAPLGWLCWMISGYPIPTIAGKLFFGFLAATTFIFFAIGGLLFLKAGSWAEEPVLPDSKTWVGPNHIPLKRRLSHVAGSAFLLVYSTWSLAIDDFVLPAKRAGIVHLHGTAALLMFFCSISVIVGLLSVIADHYDRRNNEIVYAHVSAAANWFAWTFFIAALLKRFLS